MHIIHFIFLLGQNILTKNQCCTVFISLVHYNDHVMYISTLPETGSTMSAFHLHQESLLLKTLIQFLPHGVQHWNTPTFFPLNFAYLYFFANTEDWRKSLNMKIICKHCFSLPNKCAPDIVVTNTDRPCKLWRDRSDSGPVRCVQFVQFVSQSSSLQLVGRVNCQVLRGEKDWSDWRAVQWDVQSVWAEDTRGPHCDNNVLMVAFQAR